MMMGMGGDGPGMATRCCWPPDISVGRCLYRFQPHPLQGLQGHPLAVIGTDPLVNQGQLHIFQHREALDQVVLLEDKPDLLVADMGELLVCQLPDVGAVQK